MLSVQEAQHRVLETAATLQPVAVSLREALGLVLAEDVQSDLDMPPYDKSLVDGFAVRSGDLPGGEGELVIVGELFAGQTPDRQLGPGEALRIMTGAPMPEGADSVVMCERTREPQRQAAPPPVLIQDPALRPGQHIMRQGTELTEGQRVLRNGTRIRAIELGLLACVGHAQVRVVRRPTVAVISTGDELVEAAQRPGPGQIRNSNGPMLAALAGRAGAVPEYLGIARDRPDDLLKLIRHGLKADILLLSGGVSMGQTDLVPGVLGELGVSELFHKVHLKPGKPIWFGVANLLEADPDGRAPSGLQRDGRRKLVFGLPGNPVSGVVCFELFVRPAIRKLMGLDSVLPTLVQASLCEPKPHRSDRPTYWPAWLEDGEEGFRVRPVAWSGSPDLRAIVEANAFVLFPPGDRHYRAGDRAAVLKLEW